jgi:hypothetical protein
VGRKHDRRSQWVRSLIEQREWKRAAVALANQHARVAWHLMGTAQGYRTAEASGIRSPQAGKRCGNTGILPHDAKGGE